MRPRYINYSPARPRDAARGASSLIARASFFSSLPLRSCLRYLGALPRPVTNQRGPSKRGLVDPIGKVYARTCARTSIYGITFQFDSHARGSRGYVAPRASYDTEGCVTPNAVARIPEETSGTLLPENGVPIARKSAFAQRARSSIRSRLSFFFFFLFSRYRTSSTLVGDEGARCRLFVNSTEKWISARRRGEKKVRARRR